MNVNNMICIQNVSKSFKISKKQQRLEKTFSKSKIAVSNLSIEIKKGEVFGLLGNNGAGKTTTLRMLSTLIKPDSGKITMDGVDIYKNLEESRKKIGFLTSELKLDECFTPNYLFDFFSRLYDIDIDASKNRKQFLFKEFEINKFSEMKISNLSTGMKQKISLVISIIHNPDIIIFDEPTNGLDIITSKVVIDFLLKLKNMKKTIVISSHIFSVIEKLCDTVGIIIDGNLVKCDSLRELTKSSTLEEAFFNTYYNIKNEEQNE